MPTTDPAEILLKHNRWANGQMLDACGKLSDEQLHREFPMGPGSLHNTLAHIAGSQRGWATMLAGGEPKPRIEKGGPYTFEQLRALFEDSTKELEEALAAHPLDTIATAERDGKRYAFARGGVLTHVTTHGMHHRAQCLNMLRQLGVDPLPHSSVVEWMLMVDG